MDEHLNSAMFILSFLRNVYFFSVLLRENSILANTYSPVRGIRFLTNKYLNVYPVPASGGPSGDAMRGEPHLAPQAMLILGSAVD